MSSHRLVCIVLGLGGTTGLFSAALDSMACAFSILGDNLGLGRSGGGGDFFGLLCTSASTTMAATGSFAAEGVDVLKQGGGGGGGSSSGKYANNAI